MPQDPALFERTALANAALGLRLRGVGRREAEGRALAWLERLGAAHLAARRPRGLSGGEARRVALARALACEPDVLLLDEPFAALDAPAREALLPDVRRLVRSGGVACAFVTHDRDEAAALGDRLLVLGRGRVVQEGPPDEVLRRPATPGVAAFLGVANRLAGRVTAASAGEVEVALEGGGPALVAAADLPVGAEVVACLRPEDIVLDLPPPADAPTRSSARNRLAGRVTQLAPEGPLVRVSVEIDGPIALVVLVTRRSAEDLALAPGAPVVVAWKATAVHLLRR